MAGPGPTAGAAPSFPGTVGTINAQIAPAPNR
jgi:hypothetical protein